MNCAPHDRLAAWVASTLARPVTRIEPIPGGGSRLSYVVHASDGQRHLLRVDDGHGPLSGTLFTTDREFRIISALHGAGLPVPRILARNSALNALLMEFVEGSTRFQADTHPDLRRRVQYDLMRVVVALHTLDARSAVPGGERLDNVEAAIQHDLAILKTMYGSPDVPQEPEIDFSLAWLSRNIPDPRAPSCLVHGDVGPGNFIFSSEGRVCALIDWEVAHVGHPLEDLAAVMCRALGAPFGTGPEHIANYERLTGRKVARGTLEYLLILVLTRWYVGLNMGLSHPSNALNLPVILAYRQSVAFTLVAVLARRHGMEAPLPAAQGSRSDFIHDYLMHTLTQVLRPAQTDPFLVERVDGLSTLVQYLHDLHDYGHERLQQAEQADIERLTGDRYDSIMAARSAACAMARGAVSEQARPVLHYLIGSGVRRQRVWRAAMGPMADRQLIY